MQNFSKKPILIGSDPEVFVKCGDRYISAIDKFEGTKEKPHPVPKLGRGFAMQVDNVLLEYNTPPTPKEDIWSNHHTRMLDHLRAVAKEKGCTISIDASAEMPEEELLDPRALVFGCEPDFDAWEMSINNPPKCNNPRLRSAGGHIHIGLDCSELHKINLVRFMDMILGSWATIRDPDTRRKELYGRPGAMRFKDYGAEYRTISNFWLSNAVHLGTAFALAVHCAQKHTAINTQKYKETVLKMFRNNDSKIAWTLLNEFGLREYIQDR